MACGHPFVLRALRARESPHCVRRLFLGALPPDPRGLPLREERFRKKRRPAEFEDRNSQPVFALLK